MISEIATDACTHEYQIPMDRCCIRCGQSNLLDYVSSLRQARREELSAVWQAALEAAAQEADKRGREIVAAAIRALPSPFVSGVPNDKTNPD